MMTACFNERGGRKIRCYMHDEINAGRPEGSTVDTQKLTYDDSQKFNDVHLSTL